MARNTQNSHAGISAALNDFTAHMCHKLLLTRHRPHWSTSDQLFLLERAREELDELQAALESGDRKAVVREAADAANFCIFIADNAQWDGTRPWDSHEGR